MTSIPGCLSSILLDDFICLPCNREIPLYIRWQIEPVAKDQLLRKLKRKYA